MKNQLRTVSGGRFPRVVAVLLLTAGLVSADAIVSDNRAYGCSCIRPASATVERDRTTAVFSGRVSRITPIGSGYRVAFVVENQWKGEAAKTIEVQTAGNSAACGYHFELGESYLVYAYANDDAASLWVGLCGRTSVLADASEDIGELNEGLVPSGCG